MSSKAIFDRLSELGVSPDRIQSAQVLCLPENILLTSTRSDLLEPTDSVALAKHLRSEGLTVLTLFDFGMDIPAIDRRGGDKWFGTVWVRDNLAAPTIAGVLSGLCVLAFDDDDAPPQPAAKPQAQVHVELIADTPDGQRKLKYQGDGRKLVELLQVLTDAPATD